MCTRGDFIVLPHWEIRLLVPWPNITLSDVISYYLQSLTQDSVRSTVEGPGDEEKHRVGDYSPACRRHEKTERHSRDENANHAANEGLPIEDPK